MEPRNPNHPGELSTDESITRRARTEAELEARREVLQILSRGGVEFLIGGMYAFAAFTGIYRDTKDIDLHVRRRDVERALEVLEEAGWKSDRRDPVWLYKSFKDDYFVDLVFSSGNGVCEVDDAWFEHSKPVDVLETPCRVAPAEEQIWSKAFVTERERYDGADIHHLILRTGTSLDWHRLLQRFDRYWELLLGHLMLFRFSYPSERDRVPEWVMGRLLERTQASVTEGPALRRVCRGTLLSRAMYTVDIESWGFEDGRDVERRERAAQGLPGASESPHGIY